MVIIWENCPPVSDDAPLYGAAACEFAGSMYFFGGYHSDSAAPASEIRHCVFDSSSQSWMPAVSLDVDGDVPTPRAGCTAIRVRSSVYLFGGEQVWPATQLDDFYAASIVRPGVVEWECLSQASRLKPAQGFAPALVAAAAKAAEKAAAGTVDPGTGESCGPDSEHARAAAAEAERAVLSGDSAQPSEEPAAVARGSPGGAARGGKGSPSSAVSVAASLKAKATAPPHRAWHASCLLQPEGNDGPSLVVVCGGVSAGAAFENNGLLADLWSFDTDARTWADATPLAPRKQGTKPGSKPSASEAQANASVGGLSPLPRAYHSMTPVAGGKCAVLFGGKTPTQSKTNDVFVLSVLQQGNAQKWTWAQLAPPPPPPGLKFGGEDKRGGVRGGGGNQKDNADNGANSFPPFAGPQPMCWHGACGVLMPLEFLDQAYSDAELDVLSGGGSSVGGGSVQGEESVRDSIRGSLAGGSVAGGAEHGHDQIPDDSSIDSKDSGEKVERQRNSILGGGIDKGALGLGKPLDKGELWPAGDEEDFEGGGDDDELSDRAEVVLVFGGHSEDPEGAAAAARARTQVQFERRQAAMLLDGGEGACSPAVDAALLGGGELTGFPAPAAAGGSSSSSSSAAGGNSAVAPPVPSPVYALDRRGRWHVVDTEGRLFGGPDGYLGGAVGAPVPSAAVAVAGVDTADGGPGAGGSQKGFVVHPGPCPRFGLTLVANEAKDAVLAVGGSALPPSRKAASGNASGVAEGGVGRNSLASSANFNGSTTTDGNKTGVAGQGSVTQTSYPGQRFGDAYMLSLFARDMGSGSAGGGGKDKSSGVGEGSGVESLAPSATASKGRRGKEKNKKGPQVVKVPLPDGGTYEGHLNARGQKHGEGKMTLGPAAIGGKAGERYEGSFENDKRVGEGTCWYTDGRRFVGWWENDLEDGDGVMEFPTPTFPNTATTKQQPMMTQGLLPPMQQQQATAGPATASMTATQKKEWGRTVLSYDGEWQRGKRHGEGKLRFKDGSVLAAFWRGGQLLQDPSGGQASLQSPGGAVVSECVFLGQATATTNGGGGFNDVVYEDSANGLRATTESFSPSPFTSPPWALASEQVASGVETLPVAPGGGREVYRGAFNGSGLRHCDEALCVGADGSAYRGAFRNGRRNGKGRFECAKTKEVYEGKWVAGERCGRGLCTYPAGHRYEGEWKAGLRHGSGTFFKASGESFSGSWVHGERHGHGVHTDARGRVMAGSWRQGVLLEGDSWRSPPQRGGSLMGNSTVEGRNSAAGNRDDETLASFTSLDGPSLATGASYDFNADMAFA